MRAIDHVIVGQGGSAGGRTASVFDPNTGQVQAEVRLGGSADLDRAVAGGAGGATRVGGDQSATARARDVPLQGAGRARHGFARGAALVGTRQGDRRQQGRYPARARGDRILLRHSARAQGRIYPGRRAGDRHLFDAPADRHRRRHHAVQLPGDDPAVDVRRRDCHRQRLHPQAVGARSERAGAARRTVPRGGAARGHPAGRAWRQGDGRRDPRSSRHRCGQLRRLVRHRAFTSIGAATRRASASRRWAAPRTTASSCPTPTSIRSSPISPARPSARRASAAWRCRWWCRSASAPPRRCAPS